MRHLLRVVTMIVALIASGLTLVAVAPAPPAAAAVVSYTQGSLVSAGTSRVCAPGGVQTPSSWFRRFDLTDLADREAFSARSVRFGVDDVGLPAGTPSLEVKVRVYRYPADEPDLSWEKLEAIKEAGDYTEATATVLRGTRRQLVKIDHAFGSFSRTDDAVVEVHYPATVPGQVFIIGANPAPVTEVGYFSYPTCPMTLAEIVPPPPPPYDRTEPTWSEIQPTWHVWRDMQVVIAIDGETGADGDGDLVFDAADACPKRKGSPVSEPAGCPSFGQVVSATFDRKNDAVTGTVRLDIPDGTDGVSCLDPVPVTVSDAATGARLVSGETRPGKLYTDRVFSIPAADIPDDTRISVVVDGYFDRNVQGDGIAICAAGGPAHTTIEYRADRDEDGVLTAVDSCPDVKGEPADYMNGCPQLQKSVTAVLANGIVSGKVTLEVPPPWLSPDTCGGPQRVYVWRKGDPDVKAELTDTLPDGSYAVDVSNWLQADGVRLQAQVQGNSQVGVARCMEGWSDVIEYVADRDGDGVPDRHDECPRLDPAGRDAVQGCPVLYREVTASYRDGQVSGRVSFRDGGVPASACAREQQTRVEVWLQHNDDEFDVEFLTGGHYAPVDGRYAIDVDLPVGTDYRVYVRQGVDPAAGSCWFAQSDLRTVIVGGDVDGDGDGVFDDQDRCPGNPGTELSAYPGCPFVRQLVSAGYDLGADVVSGQVTIDVPGGTDGVSCLGPARVTLYDATTSVAFGSAWTTGPSGAYAIDVSDLAEGTEVVARAGSYFDVDENTGEGIAVCRSSSNVASAVVTRRDGDGDGVPDAHDACAALAGDIDDDPAFSGCPTLTRTVTASYDDGIVSGAVSAAAGACAQQQPISVFVVPEVAGSERVDLTTEGDGTFSVLMPLPAHTRFAVEATRVLDAEGLGICGADTSEVVEVPGDSVVDTDGDGVDDELDRCPEVDGPATEEDFPGCPTLARTVTASYDGAIVSGEVRSPSDACAQEQPISVFVVPEVAGSQRVDLTTNADGTFSVVVDLQPLARFAVEATPVLHAEGLGICAAATSTVVWVPGNSDVDTDGDDVNDELDQCPEVDGPADEEDFPGCPTLARTVTASYDDGVVSGEVSAASGACAQVQTVSIFEVPVGPASTRLGVRTEADGSYSVRMSLPGHALFAVEASRVLDAQGRGICPAATSAVVEVPGDSVVDTDGDGLHDDVDQCVDVGGPADEPDFPGCPTLARTVTASYHNATISGQVGVLGPNAAPAGVCLLTGVKAFTIRDGVAVQVGATTTTPTGSYTIALGNGLAAGSTYFVTTSRHLVDAVAVCGSAHSVNGQVPGAAPVVDPPGGKGPEAAAVAPALSGVKLTKKIIHVRGSRARPRATRLLLRLNVAANVLVVIKGTSKVTGKKVRARLSKPLGSGASSIKVSGKVGRTRLPPGRYRVTVRATNVAGSSTAVAGRLTVKP